MTFMQRITMIEFFKDGDGKWRCSAKAVSVQTEALNKAKDIMRAPPALVGFDAPGGIEYCAHLSSTGEIIAVSMKDGKKLPVQVARFELPLNHPTIPQLLIAVGLVETSLPIDVVSPA